MKSLVEEVPNAKPHVIEKKTSVYNPLTNNHRYSDNNKGEPKHHPKNSVLSGQILWLAEIFQQFKRDNPKISKLLSNYSPLFFFMLAFALAVAGGLIAYFLPVIGLPIAFGFIAAAVLSLASAGITVVLRWLTTDVFGWSLSDPSETIYQDAAFKLGKVISANNTTLEIIKSPSLEDMSITCKYGTATGTLSVPGGNRLPKLKLVAENHADAGYLEGYMQGEEMFRTLQQMNKVFGKIEFVIKLRQLVGNYKSDEELHQYFDEMLKKIPPHIKEEMVAKVEGYNQWIDDKKLPAEHKLDIYKYFRLQLLPDIHNFNPFVKDQGDTLFGAELVSNACTTIAYKVGDYTCYIRILDWASHNIAGKACIEIERDINGIHTSDVAMSLLSGGVSMVRHNGDNHMLVQINVAPVDKDKKNLQGMPGAFVIRHLAETCDSVEEMRNKMIKGDDKFFNNGPLSGMHVTATDGKDTISFHAYQGNNEAHHLLEVMDEGQLVVPNFGSKEGKVFDFHDSSLRLENANRFFMNGKLETTKNNLTGNIQEDIEVLQETMNTLIQTDLVNNCESVFAGMYILLGGKIISAKAAIDNGYAGSRKPEEMMDLSTVDIEDQADISKEKEYLTI